MTNILAVKFSLPLPPSINKQYATVKNRRILTREARRYKRRVINLLERWQSTGRISEAFVHALQQGYIGLFLDFYFKTPLRRDLDGGLKIAQDSICTAFGVDDRRVVSLQLLKHIDPRKPRVEVEIEAIAEWRFDVMEYEYVGG